MNTEIQSVIEAIANDVLILSQLILEDNGISNENVRTQIASLGDPVVIEALFDNYVDFIEHDRPREYGKQPPIDALRDWALSRGIPTDNGTLFLIARAIWRDGHEGRPIIATLEKEIEESFDKEFYTKLFNSTINELIKYFN